MTQLKVSFKTSFLREFKKLESALQNEVREKIELFQNPSNHATLRVHKLKGQLKGYLSFSVNYRYRVVFKYADASKSEAILFTVGDHEVYR